MAKKVDMKERILKLMHQPEQIKNMGIIAHVDHGKTTTCDSLLAGAGIISEELAGDQTWLDYDEIEQKRGVTIKSANCSMVHEYGGTNYLINLIDTPGHVDFGGDVTRALRAVDGAIVLTDAVEGVMPQTETVLRQALKEYVRPILYINKVDRFVRELKYTPEQMQECFIKIINDVNNIIHNYAPKEFRDKWKVSVNEGSVAFGSSYYRWATNLEVMQRTKIGFAEIIKKVEEDCQDELHQKTPLTDTLLTMVIRHLPNPRVAQAYRIKQIWRGDLEGDVGKSLVGMNPDGPVVGCVTKVVNDPHAGIVAAVRLFSGTIKKGMSVKLLNKNVRTNISQIAIYKGAFRLLVDEIPAGNILAIVGIEDADSGETITSLDDMEPFESIKHMFEPVVTKSIESKQPKDLPKLINALRDIAREDPCIKVTINQETGENLICGLGELHLEVWQSRLERDWRVNVNVSEPIVVYRETVTALSPEVEGKSPNKHNKFYLTVEPMSEELRNAIFEGVVREGVVKKKKDEELFKTLQELGLEKDAAKRVKVIHSQCMFIDMTRGQVHLPEIMETVIDGFTDTIDSGPLAKERISGMIIKLIDCKLHEDAIHRGPAQVIPAIRNAIRNAMAGAEPLLLEPVQKIRIDSPQEFLGTITSMVTQRRGSTLEIKEEHGAAVVIAEMPVAEMFGFTGDLRGATQGKGFWSLMDSKFKPLPKNKMIETLNYIRKRKGLELVKESEE